MEMDSPRFEFSGGHLCLDFANTVDDRPTDHSLDSIGSYGDLLAWSRQAGIFTEHEVRRLLRASRARSEEALVALARAKALREANYRFFSALAGHLEPPGADLAILNRELASAFRRACICPAGESYAWGWAADESALDRMLWDVVRSAAELLASGAWVTVRECARHDCGWLFIDTSRNHSRRWCNMQICGNRTKAARHYRRRKRTS